jgi:hypothetical protein
VNSDEILQIFIILKIFCKMQNDEF